MNLPYLLAITGASGAVYATRLLEVLTSAGHDVHLTISQSARLVLKQELDVSVDLNDFHASSFLLDADTGSLDQGLDTTRTLAGVSTEDSSVLPIGTRPPGSIVYHHFEDLMAGPASGSFLTAGMIICPCSGGTLSAVVHGASGNLIQRAAQVHLKERRPLILVPRETPLSLGQLDNMRRACELGAVVLPAAPGWYHGVHSLRDLVDFIVARILDQLRVPHSLMRRWGSDSIDD